MAPKYCLTAQKTSWCWILCGVRTRPPKICLVSGREWRRSDQKKNGRAFYRRYFRTWIFSWCASFFVNSVLLFAFHEILFLPIFLLLIENRPQNFKKYQESPYRRIILRRSRICYQKPDISTQSWVIVKKQCFSFSELRSFFAPSEGEIWKK